MNAEQRIDLWLWSRVGRMNRHTGARGKFYGMFVMLMHLIDRRQAAEHKPDRWDWCRASFEQHELGRIS